MSEDRLTRLERFSPGVVVPGHGHRSGPQLIPEYRAYFARAFRRSCELRAAGELSEAEIVDRVADELLDLHPDWQNRNWAKPTVADLSWPARA